MKKEWEMEVAVEVMTFHLFGDGPCTSASLVHCCLTGSLSAVDIE